MNSKVDSYIENETMWQEEFEQLREIILPLKLTEDFKWGHPCYSYNGNNLVLIHGFKEYCALLFFKGALLKDPENLLVQQSKNVQAARQIRFRNSKEILKLKKKLRAYIIQAIEIEKAGLKVQLKKTSEFNMPEEFQKKLNNSKKLSDAFKSLTPGRQRAYLLYFSSPKQSKTRESRVEKYIPSILNGKGLND